MNQDLINQKPNYTPQIIIIGILFFIFGFVTWLNSTLIPYLQIACELETSEAVLVTFAFYISYAVMAFPSSWVLKRTGYKNGMMWGLICMAIGAAIFIPAAQARTYGLFLTGLFVTGTGLALLQTASNPYITILGPIESAAKRISIMGLCNKIAGALSPLIIGAIVLKDAAQLEAAIIAETDPAAKDILLNQLTSRIINPYIVIAIILLVLAFIIKRSSLPEIESEDDIQQKTGEKTKTSVFHFPHLLLGVLCLFLYVGVEVMAGDAIGIYGRSIGISLDKTKYFTSFTLVSMLAGYVISIFTIPKIISQQTGLKLSAILGIIFTICVFVTNGFTSIVFIALLGLANALMWPAIFPLAISGLGKFIKIGSALLIMGIAGGAIIPLIYGSLKEMPAIGNNLAFLICMLPCYLYILYYSMAGYKAGK